MRHTIPLSCKSGKPLCIFYILTFRRSCEDICIYVSRIRACITAGVSEKTRIHIVLDIRTNPTFHGHLQQTLFLLKYRFL